VAEIESLQERNRNLVAAHEEMQMQMRMQMMVEKADREDHYHDPMDHTQSCPPPHLASGNYV
jgi:hypothetical protein